uniref:Neurotrimin n=1 Tax=Glossina palpalis gambiensis TaxID=67801 RepID=A0A1B0B9W6_9MUSC
MFSSSLKIIAIFISLLNNCKGVNVINFEFTEDFKGREFHSVPTTVKTFENDTVLLPCDYKFSYGSVRWLKDDLLIVDAPHSEEVSLKRYRLLVNGSLVVMDVQREDTGKYYCEIMSNTVKAVQIHAIEVQYPPRIFASPSGFIELPLGALLEIICETDGVPQPAITWTHNNATVIDYLVGNRQSHIVEIKTRNMSGTIECTANNGVGRPATDGVELSVLFAPEIRASQKVIYSKIGVRVALQCFVESAPIAKIRWLHDGRVISPTRYIRQDVEIPSNSSALRYYADMKHVLIFKNVRDSDMGMYECRAENTIGVASAYMELTFRPMPCTFKISPDMQSPTSHLLVWQTESFSPVIEFKLKFRQIPSESSLSSTTVTTKLEWTELTIPADISIGSIYTTSFTLYGLHPASIYQVVVLARNHYGWSDSSKILRFATGGEVEFPNYSTEAETYDANNSNDNDGANGISNTNDGRTYGSDNSDDDPNEKSFNEITDNSIVAQKSDEHKLYKTVVFYTSRASAIFNNKCNNHLFNLLVDLIIVYVIVFKFYC